MAIVRDYGEANLMNPLIKTGQILLQKGSKIAIQKGGKVIGAVISDEVLKKSVELGNDYIAKQKELIKIPDVVDVQLEEAVKVLKDDFGLTPLPATAQPKIEYAQAAANVILYTVPKVGAKVMPKAVVKVYYITPELLEKSKVLNDTQIKEVKVNTIIGMQFDEGRQELLGKGLKVTEKIETANIKLIHKNDGEVTRITRAKIDKPEVKFKTGDAVWLYYVDQNVIDESKALKVKRDQEAHDKVEKRNQAAKDLTSGLYHVSSKVAMSGVNAATKGVKVVVSGAKGVVRGKKVEPDGSKSKIIEIVEETIE